MLFYRGQRVKKVRNAPDWDGSTPTVLVGTELCFSHYEHIPKGTRGLNGKLYGYDADCVCIYNGLGYGFQTSQLEPIIPEGSRTVLTWESCTWRPEHLREKQDAEV